MTLSPPTQSFIDFFADLGPRWGLPADACRLHAFLYLSESPLTQTELMATLSLTPEDLRNAVHFLKEYQMVEESGASHWLTSGDPWDLMLAGLEHRKNRELPNALEVLRECDRQATENAVESDYAAGQIKRMLALVEDLAAIDMHSKKISPALIKDFLSLSGRAARFLEQATGQRGRKE